MTSWSALNDSNVSSSSSVSFADDFQFSKAVQWRAGDDYYQQWEEYLAPGQPLKKPATVIRMPKPTLIRYEEFEEAPAPEEVLSPQEGSLTTPQIPKFDKYLETLCPEERTVAIEIKEQFDEGAQTVRLHSEFVASSMIPLPVCFGGCESGSSQNFVFEPETSRIESLRASKKDTRGEHKLDISDWPNASELRQKEVHRKKRSFDELISSLGVDGNEASRGFGCLVADALREKSSDERVALAQEIWAVLTTSAAKKMKLTSE